MPKGSIYVLGEEEYVIVFGLLGIEGRILNRQEDFINEFEKLVKSTSIGMIIIAIDLFDDTLEIIMDFKLNNKKPFVFYLPNVFKPHIESEDVFNKAILKSINNIIFSRRDSYL